MIQHGHSFKLMVIQTDQRPHRDIVNAGFHSPVKGIEPPEIIRFQAAGVNRLIGRPVISFLKNLIGADTGGFNRFKSFDIQRRRIDIDTADFSPAFFGFIKLAHRCGNKFGIITGMFAVNHDQAFVPARFQSANFFLKLPHGQRLAHQFKIRTAKTAVSAVVDAVVSHIKRSKKDNSVAVNRLFQFTGTLFYPFNQFRVFGIKQDGHLFRIKAVFRQRFGDNVLNQAAVV